MENLWGLRKRITEGLTLKLLPCPLSLRASFYFLEVISRSFPSTRLYHRDSLSHHKPKAVEPETHVLKLLKTGAKKKFPFFELFFIGIYYSNEKLTYTSLDARNTLGTPPVSAWQCPIKPYTRTTRPERGGPELQHASHAINWDPLVFSESFSTQRLSQQLISAQ